MDQFCSSTPWILPAHQALMPERELVFLESDNGYVALARGMDPNYGIYLEPLECMWQFSSPFACVNEELAGEFSEFIESGIGQWNLLILTGLYPHSSFFRKLTAVLEKRFRLVLLGSATRISARILDGVDGFLSRRSPKFRSSLKQAIRRGVTLGIEFEEHYGVTCSAHSLKLYERVLDIERRSHKGKAEMGIEQPGMRKFYELMLPRLVITDGLRMIFARHEGRDIGFAFGGVKGLLFRGLQMSFDQDYARYSVGNLLQYQMMTQLEKEGAVLYDLGSDMEYKRRWGEERFLTVSLGVTRV